MVKHFVVSNDKKFYPPPGNNNLYSSNDYICYKDKDVKLVPKFSFTKEDIEDCSEVVSKKYTSYINLLSVELNSLHNEHLSSFFWEKSLGLSFKRYVSIMYLAYLEFSYFKPDNFDVYSVLAKESFYIPDRFEEQRSFLQHSDLGREQLFSLFLEACHSETYTKAHKVFAVQNLDETVSLTSRIKFFIKKTIESLSYRRNSAVVAILDSFFSKANRKELTSINGIITMNLNSNTDNFELNYLRESFGEKFVGEDNFDLFFASSLKVMLPKFFIEKFSKNLTFFKNELNQYPKLKFIICEAWISNTRDAFFLALAKEFRDVHHIYNEHNTLLHPFLGNNTKLAARLVDVYYTLGWTDDVGVGSLRQGSSLFFDEPDNIADSNDTILFIDVASFGYLEEFLTKYSESEFFVESYFSFLKTFFLELGGKLRSTIVYRDYPVSDTKWKIYDVKEILKNYLPHNLVFDDKKLSGPKMMMQSRLNVVSYTNTAYLESIIWNRPTVFFWNKEVAHLEADFDGFFDVLIDAGICQTNPRDAALFIASIEDDVVGWWTSPETQKARKVFLDKNIGPSSRALNYYKSLLDI